MDDWTIWARALASELGLRPYRPGSFACLMARAALAADSGNLARIGQGFPCLVKVLGDWQRYGGEYLLALAAGDDDALVAAYEAYTERVS